ncbi:ABC-type transport auxiliary lipoprotein family protein [Sodalis sp. RH20]|uniref:ABC-type transport auxiliary lipoprotein family protein n=1 Tax=unclassified Sodalis (in: enterobacteria) TaxID=2636512 RepID=UPI0039B5B760
MPATSNASPRCWDARCALIAPLHPKSPLQFDSAIRLALGRETLSQLAPHAWPPGICPGWPTAPTPCRYLPFTSKRQFDVWPGQFVEFAADWRLSRLSGDRRIGLTCHSQFTELALGEDATMLASQRQVITRLAAQIATQARNWVRDNRDVCAAP